VTRTADRQTKKDTGILGGLSEDNHQSAHTFHLLKQFEFALEEKFYQYPLRTSVHFKRSVFSNQLIARSYCRMAWLEEKYDGKTSLSWWQVRLSCFCRSIFKVVGGFIQWFALQASFKSAAADLFHAIDTCAIQDVQVCFHASKNFVFVYDLLLNVKQKTGFACSPIPYCGCSQGQRRHVGRKNWF